MPAAFKPQSIVFRPFCSLFLLAILLQLAHVAGNDTSNCSCYVMSGDVPAYFLYHRFYDFRNISVEGNNSYVDGPPSITGAQDNGTEPATSSFFNNAEFTNDWSVQNWTRNGTAVNPIRMVNSAQNVYIARDDPSSPTYLVLRTNRLAAFQSVSELETTNRDILHASFRVSVRVSGSSGGVAGIFTYANDDNESDIEILTRDDITQIRATNQPSEDAQGNAIPDAETQMTLPSHNGGGNWHDWNTYRLDWLPAKSAWFVNGLSAVNKTYGVPRLPSRFLLNMWGNGGPWSGEMSVGGAARLEVQWVEMVFNTSGNTGGKKGCEIVCGIDGGAQVGLPQPVSVSGAGAGRGINWVCIGWVFLVGMFLI